jgi:multidrug resistance protein MdtO
VSTATAVPSHAASRPRPLQPEGRVSWALEFLRRELAPYPGRLSTVTRMVLAATLTMLIIMTFHLPAGALGGYFALIISRESLGSTAKQTWLTIVFFCLGTVYVMLGIAVFVDSPYSLPLGHRLVLPDLFCHGNGA